MTSALIHFLTFATLCGMFSFCVALYKIYTAAPIMIFPVGGWIRFIEEKRREEKRREEIRPG